MPSGNELLKQSVFHVPWIWAFAPLTVFIGNMEEYDETKDADFNPVYCNDTLSDVESEDEPENEAQPEVIQLKSNACMFKVENMKIPPMEPNFEDETNEEETGEMEDWKGLRYK